MILSKYVLVHWLNRTIDNISFHVRWVAAQMKLSYGMSTVLTSATSSVNQRCSSLMRTSLPDICRFFISPSSANVQSCPQISTARSVSGEMAYLESIRAPPLLRAVLLDLVPLVPELDSVTRGQRGVRGSRGTIPTWTAMRLSVKEKSSLRSLYPSSFAHFLLRNSTISLRPTGNWSRFLQRESGYDSLSDS